MWRWYWVSLQRLCPGEPLFLCACVDLDACGAVLSADGEGRLHVWRYRCLSSWEVEYGRGASRVGLAGRCVAKEREGLGQVMVKWASQYGKKLCWWLGEVCVLRGQGGSGDVSSAYSARQRIDGSHIAAVSCTFKSNHTCRR